MRPASEHDRIQELLDDYLLRRLDQQQEAAVEEHLLACGACFEAVQWRERMVLGLQDADRRGQLLLPEAIAGRTSWGWLWGDPVRLALAAAVALMIYPAYLGMRGRPEPSEGPRSLSRTYALFSSEERMRGSVAQAVEVEDGPGGFILAAALPIAPVAGARVEAEIRDAAGALHYRIADLSPVDEFGTYSIMFPSGSLSPGRYELVLVIVGGDLAQPTRYHYPLTLVPSPRTKQAEP